MAHHQLKTWSEFFAPILSGDKTFEVRYNDRAYKVGDTLDLREYEQGSGTYTGRRVEKRVSYVLPGGRFGVEEGYVVMGLGEV